MADSVWSPTASVAAVQDSLMSGRGAAGAAEIRSVGVVVAAGRSPEMRQARIAGGDSSSVWPGRWC
jgi:hypothetical protein